MAGSQLMVQGAMVLAGIWCSLALAQNQGGGAGVGELPEGVKAYRDLAYQQPPIKAQKLDLYIPAKGKGEGEKPLPLIIWIHGGAWSGGSKGAPNPAMPLLAEGYAVASVEYRLSSQGKFPAQIYDCKAAVRYLRANAGKYNLDPKRFGAWGGSAGGHLVALLGTSGGVKELEGKTGNLEESSRVQCVCDWFGPTDFTTIIAQSGPEIKVRHDTPDAPETHLIGGLIQENPEKAKAVSPVSYVSKEAPPFLIMHGDRDDAIPLAQSQELDEALRKVGVESTLIVVKGAGHGLGGPRAWEKEELMKPVREFFAKHLGK